MVESELGPGSAHVPELNYHNHVRWSWQVGGIWDDLMSGNNERARARAGLLLAAADQASIDGGSWVMSTVSLMEGVPPFQEFSKHPESGRSSAQCPLRSEMGGPVSDGPEGARGFPRSSPQTLPCGSRRPPKGKDTGRRWWISRSGGPVLMHVRRLWTGASFPLPRFLPIQAPLFSTMRREAHILVLLDLLEAVQLGDPLNATMTEAGMFLALVWDL